ncbi:DUF1634 domain-containing protein [Alloprevotella tannerae]
MRQQTSTEKTHPAAPQDKPCTKEAAGEASGDGTSRDLSLLVARTLRIGVALAGLIALAGGIGYLWRHGSETLPDLSRFSYNALPENAEAYTTLGGIFGSVGQMNPIGWIQLGVLVLILTPFLRVVISFFDFLKQRDWLYAGITAFVLGVIILNSLNPLH